MRPARSAVRSPVAAESAGTGRDRRRELDAVAFTQLIERRQGVASGATDAVAGAPAGQGAPFSLVLMRSTPGSGPHPRLPTNAALGTLSLVRERLEQALRGEDRFCVLGVNELLIYLAGAESAALARLAMTRLVRVLMQPGQEQSKTRLLHPALGCVVCSRAGEDADSLVARAADACTVAAGREDRICISAETAEQANRAELAPLVRTAIETNQLEMYYQPQWNLRARSCVSVEALLRWPRGLGGTSIPTDVLVDIAERHGWMRRLTQFVLNTSLRQLRDLAQAGIDTRVAINIPPSLLEDGELTATVAQSLDLWGVDARKVTLEVTEVSELHDWQAAMQAMKALRELGTRLSIDDFGTGHSSLARLRAMPLAELKVDRMFVANMDRSSGDLQIVRTVIDLAHNFELEVVAEGVEDDATARHLDQLGCEILQGYVVARPMPLPDLIAWWRNPPDGERWLHEATPAP